MNIDKPKLKSFVERIERLDEEGKVINDDKRDVYAEAKAQGLDVKALKIVIGRRRQKPDELSARDDLVDLYENALGTPVATRAGATTSAEVHSLAPKPAPTESRNAAGDMPPIPDNFRRPKATA